MIATNDNKLWKTQVALLAKKRLKYLHPSRIKTRNMGKITTTNNNNQLNASRNHSKKTSSIYAPKYLVTYKLIIIIIQN